MENKDFIFTSLQSWDVSIGSTVREIAKEISKKNRVLFINSPLDIKTFYGKEKIHETEFRRNVVKSGKVSIRQFNKNIWVIDFPFTVMPVQFLPDGYLFDLVNRWNNRKIYTESYKIAKQLGFKNYNLFIDNDLYRSFYAAKYLKPLLSIFYYRDHLQKTYWEKHAPRLRPKICAKSDLVLTNSETFKTLLQPFNPERTYCVGQGVNLEQFDIKKLHPTPDDIKMISRPIIGYTGYLTSIRLDLELIYETAKSRPNYSFVLVGPEDEIFAKHPLHKLNNVYFLGEKTYDLIPAYIQSFDVCINPQIVNEVTNGNYPLKVDEYLCMGKPVIVTKTDFMETFDDTCWICTNYRAYIEAIEEALQPENNTTEKIESRTKMAESHSWTHCIERIYEQIKKLQE